MTDDGGELCSPQAYVKGAPAALATPSMAISQFSSEASPVSVLDTLASAAPHGSVESVESAAGAARRARASLAARQAELGVAQRNWSSLNEPQRDGGEVVAALERMRGRLRRVQATQLAKALEAEAAMRMNMCTSAEASP